MTELIDTDDHLANQIKKNSWRQGSVLPFELVNCLELGRHQQEGIWVVLSHDCDVANYSFTLEPNVEVIFGKFIEFNERNGNNEWGKNSRRLQMSMQTNELKLVEFNASDRCVFDRKKLASHIPIQNQLGTKIQILIEWIAKRYVRRGFPDCFVKRTQTAVHRLRKHFKKKGEVLSGIYLHVSDEELTEKEYELIVFGAMRDEDFQEKGRRDAANNLLSIVEAELSGCDGVTVSFSELRSESEISLTDIRLMKRWDFDDLSVREQDELSVCEP